MHIVFALGYFLLGLVQFLAVITGLQVFGVHWLLSAFIALFVAYTPIIGTAAGVYGAMYGWNWELLPALALFLGPLVVALVIAGIATAIETASERKHRRLSSR